MKRSIIALLNPGQTVHEVLTRRFDFIGAGFELEGVVDPEQSEPVTVSDGVFVTNSVAVAAQICRSALFQYADTIIHSSALEVSSWKHRIM